MPGEDARGSRSPAAAFLPITLLEKESARVPAASNSKRFSSSPLSLLLPLPHRLHFCRHVGGEPSGWRSASAASPPMARKRLLRPLLDERHQPGDEARRQRRFGGGRFVTLNRKDKREGLFGRQRDGVCGPLLQTRQIGGVRGRRGEGSARTLFRQYAHALLSSSMLRRFCRRGAASKAIFPAAFGELVPVVVVVEAA